MFRADALEVPTQRGGLFSVPNLTPEQLSMEAAQVTGSFMHLEYLPCVDRPTQDGALLIWKGEVGRMTQRKRMIWRGRRRRICMAIGAN